MSDCPACCYHNYVSYFEKGGVSTMFLFQHGVLEGNLLAHFYILLDGWSVAHVSIG
jgi:hypothetical protein